MFDFSRFTGSFRLSKRMERSMRHTFTVVTTLFRNGNASDSDRDIRVAVLSVFRRILESDGPLKEADLESLRQLLTHDYSPFEVDKLIAELKNQPPLPTEEIVAALGKLPPAELERVLRAFLYLAVSTDALEHCTPLISDLAERTGFSARTIRRITDEITAEHLRRRRIIRSGAGILVALIVIAVFILTATLLRSVIFGLIAAYVMLPLEKYFERRLYRKKGIGYLIFRVVDFIYAPLRNLAARLQRRGRGGQPDEVEIRKRAARKIITQAVTLTCGVMLIFVILLVSGISLLTNHYFQNLKGWTRAQMAESSSRLSVAEPVVATESGVPGKAESIPARTVVPGEDGIWANGAGKLIEQGLIYLERLRERFQSLPLVKWGLDQISRILHDESAQRELAGYLLQRTGGLFSFTAGVIGTIGVVITDLLLAIFFFLLFLMKLAEFCGPGFEILLTDGHSLQVQTLEELLPLAFGPGNLQ